MSTQVSTPIVNGAPTDPHDVRALIQQALSQPTVALPGSTSLMTPEAVRSRISEAFVSRGIGNTMLSDYRPRASSAGACARALTYHRTGVSETDPLDPEIGLTLELGTLLHLYLDAVLVAFGLPVEIHEYELRVPYAYGEITGHFDRSIGGTVIVDYKSASRATFDMMVETNTPLPSHRAQTNFYVHAAKLAVLPYTHGLVVAYCKDPGVGQSRTPWVSPPLAYDPTLAQTTVRMFEEVERHARAYTLPDRPYLIPHEFPCKGCRWRSKCWDATDLQSDVPANLSDLEAVVTRYKQISGQAKELKDQSDALNGQLKAAMLDHKVAKAIAGVWDLSLSQYGRDTIDPDLVPPEVAKIATKTTMVTQLRATKNKKRSVLNGKDAPPSK